jgi:transposase-like protein
MEAKTKKKRKTHPEEFKREAVRLLATEAGARRAKKSLAVFASDRS